LLIEFSLILLASSFIFSLRRRLVSFSLWNLEVVTSAYFLTMLCCVYLTFKLDNSLAPSPYLIAPGSLFSRTILPFPEYLSRILEPFYIILFFILEYLACKNNSRVTGLARIVFLLAWFLEVLLFYYLCKVPPFVTQLTWAIALILYMLALQGACIGNKKSISPIYSFLVFFLVSFSFTNLVYTKSPNIKGTHYYVWFPENWKAGYGTGEKDSEPKLGQYDTDNSNIVRAHLKEITEQGISLVILDWWPRNPLLKKRALKVAEILKEFPDLKFAIQMETLDLGLDKNSNLITLNEKRINDLSKFFEYTGIVLFSHKQYFKIKENPAVFMYASRHLVGDAKKAFFKIKKHTQEKTGFTPYLIGDEVFYQVPEGKNSKEARLRPQFIPAWDRLRTFDAITLYNPYDPTHHYKSLESGDSSEFLEKSYLLYSKYKDIAHQAGIPFFPTVIPAYNDKAIRPNLNHQIIPREDGNGVSTLWGMFEISKEFENKRGLNLTVITSFNEWNEGTNLER